MEIWLKLLQSEDPCLNEGGSAMTNKNGSNNLMSLMTPLKTSPAIGTGIGTGSGLDTIFSGDPEFDNVYKWLEICDPWALFSLMGFNYSNLSCCLLIYQTHWLKITQPDSSKSLLSHGESENFWLVGVCLILSMINSLLKKHGWITKLQVRT